MRLEDQVVNLELAKKLKTLGVKQESLWYWADIPGYGPNYLVRFQNHHEGNFWYSDRINCHFEENKIDKVYSAFTVAELGEMLPNAYRTCRTGTGKWLGYSSGDIDGPEDLLNTLSDTEANARAKMLIHLIEKGVVKI